MRVDFRLPHTFTLGTVAKLQSVDYCCDVMEVKSRQATNTEDNKADKNKLKAYP